MIGLLKAKEYEYNFYSVKRISDVEYALLDKDNNRFGLIHIEDQYLDLMVGEKSHKFLQSQKATSGFENVRLINKALVSRGYDPLEKLLLSDSLNCECNLWVGGKNLVSIQGKPQAWVLSIDEGQFVISKMSEPLDPDDEIILTELSRLAWKI